MSDVGIFEVLASDESDARNRARKALLLSEARVTNRLGAFLASRTPEEFDARLSLVVGDFEGIVRQACEEIGHENADAILKSLRAHYRPAAAEDDEEEDGRTDWQKKRDAQDGNNPDDEDEDDEKTSSASGGQAVSPLEAKQAEQYNPSDQDDDANKTVSCPQCGGDGKSNGGTTCSKCQGKGKVNDWGPSTLDNVDSKVAEFYPGQQGNSDQELDYLNSEHPIDYSGALRSLEGEHQQGIHQQRQNPDCPLCDHPGEGWVDNGQERYHPAYGKTAGEGNTDLGGPEPKIDKRRWTPETVKKPDEDSKQHPTEQKDPVEPIKAVNDDELKEIGEKTTEKETLPSSEDSGFSSGGESKGPSTKTWSGKDGQTEPVKSEALAAVRWSNIKVAHEGQCPNCGGPSKVLGQLGNRTHYRCENCGMDHSETPPLPAENMRTEWTPEQISPVDPQQY